MAKKEVVWTLSSLQDRMGIYQYWSHRNKSDAYSKKLELLFEVTARLICQFPELGTQTNISGVRVKVIRTFKLFYKVNFDKLEILRVWDSRQNPEDAKII